MGELLEIALIYTDFTIYKREAEGVKVAINVKKG